MLSRIAVFAIASASPLFTPGIAQADVPEPATARPAHVLTRLPVPGVGANASPRTYLVAARNARGRNQPAPAEEALERGQARLLDTEAETPAPAPPFIQHALEDIGVARHTLQQRDRLAAI